jgi:hypothetical protein
MPGETQRTVHGMCGEGGYTVVGWGTGIGRLPVRCGRLAGVIKQAMCCLLFSTYDAFWTAELRPGSVGSNQHPAGPAKHLELFVGGRKTRPARCCRQLTLPEGGTDTARHAWQRALGIPPSLARDTDRYPNATPLARHNREAAGMAPPLP